MLVALAACMVHFTGPCDVVAPFDKCKSDEFISYEKIFTGEVIKEQDGYYEISTNAFDTERVMVPVDDCVVKKSYRKEK